MKTRQAIKLLDQLMDSDGWQYLVGIMNDEILQTAYSLSDHPETSVRNLDFKRGAMWAGRRMVEMPERLKTKLENELFLEEANRKLNKDDKTNSTQ